MKKKIVIFLVVGVLVLGLGVSLAYFTPIITGNGKEISLVAKELKVIYTDTSAINSGVIEPGWHTSKTFTVENRSDDVYKYNIVIEDLLNTFETEDFLQYKITNNGSGYTCNWTNVPKTTEATDTILAYSVSIEDKEVQSYTIEFRYSETEEDQSVDMGKSFNGSIMIEVGTEKPLNLPPFIAKLVKDNKDIKTRDVSSFSSAFTGTGGLYKEDNKQFLEEDGRTQEAVYYFSGDATNMNNWVKFGKEGTDDIWWRIIRTNEDGSVRLLYAGKGTEGHKTTTGYIGNTTYPYNSTYNNTMYVGYKYGTTGSLVNNRTNGTNSPIKKTIDTWYDTNMILLDNQNYSYGSYLSRTAIYCNDRANPAYAATSEMYYAGYKRLVDNKRPSFKCGNNESGELYKNSGSGSTIGGADVADRFTGSNLANIGNEALGDKPIALMTADEVSYAGGVYGSNSPKAYYYLNSAGGSTVGDKWWWTMSPSYYGGSSAYVFDVDGSSYPGNLDWNYVDSSGGVRPVVSLKSCVSVSGSGKTSDPYIPSIDSACALADN